MCGDGYAFSYYPRFNGPQDLAYDLAETGYKFSDLGEDQVNYLMGYDINLEKPEA